MISEMMNEIERGMSLEGRGMYVRQSNKLVTYCATAIVRYKDRARLGIAAEMRQAE